MTTRFGFVRVTKLLSSVSTLLLASVLGFGQSSTGTTPFGSSSSPGSFSVDESTLNIHWQFPIVNADGITFSYPFDSIAWHTYGAGTSKWTFEAQPIVGNYNSLPATGSSYGIYPGSTTPLVGYFGLIFGWTDQSTGYATTIFQDPSGTAHDMGPNGLLALDGSGWTSTDGYHMIAKSGITFSPVTGVTANNPDGYCNSVGCQIKDTSGNTMTATPASGSTWGCGGTVNFTDATATVVMTLAEACTSTTKLYTFGYTAAANKSQSVVMSYSTHSIASNFGLGPIELPATNYLLLDSIKYPDASTYTLKYEATPGSSTTTTGRLFQVKMPTGGTISFLYANGTNHDGEACSTDAASNYHCRGIYLHKSGDSLMTYKRTLDWPGSSTSSINYYETTVTDAHGNDTVIHYGENASGGATLPETKKFYSGPSTATNPVLLQVITICYNTPEDGCIINHPGDASNTSFPIIQRSTYLAVGNNKKRVTSELYDNFPLTSHGQGGTRGQFGLVATVGASDWFTGSEIDNVTSITSAGDVLTITANNHFAVGDFVTLENTKEDSLNGMRLSVTSSSPTQFTASYNSFTIGLISDTSDTGVAVKNLIYPNINVSNSVFGNNYNSTTGTCTEPFGVVDSLSQQHIWDRVCFNTVTDSSGTIKAQTQMAFDGNTGQAVKVQGFPATSTSLTANYTYNANGTIRTVTEPNTALTTFGYGTGGCSYLVTSILNVVGTTSMTHDCTGRVPLTITDLNSHTATIVYTDLNDQGGAADPYWRPTSRTDRAAITTNYFYGPYSGGRTYAKSQMLVGTTGAIYTVSDLDAYGRKDVEQTEQSKTSSNYDTVSYLYDSAGRWSGIRLPCVTAQFSLCLTLADSRTYDALGRLLESKDTVGATVTYSYTANDTLVTLGPQTTGENLKQKQFEYDGAGRLTSVCEITSLPGRSVCGQNNSQTGFWTRYQYDAIGNLTGICQNTTVPMGTDCVANPSSGQQTRTMTYDMLGRVLTVITPERGTVANVYDVPYSFCTASSQGDLTAYIAPSGNVVCHGYDALHRPTSLLSYNSAGSCTEHNTYFVYDSATPPSGVTVTNGKGRLLEASTKSCSGALLTDEWFSYDNDGRPTTFYESTPNSGQYYAITQVYEANGIVNTLSGLPGMSPVFYSSNLDGEGRVQNVIYQSSTPQTLVSSVTYVTTGNGTSYTQPIGSISQIVLGSGDTDNFTYDKNTAKMTQWSFSVGAGATPQTDTGTVTYNTNGSTQSLAIVNQLNPPENQTCNYASDDLTRLSKVDCGAIWGQNFSYDPFGNLTKTPIAGDQGTTWNPGYDQSNNRYTFSGVAYDANGDLTNDSIRTYAWDSSYGFLNSVTVAGVTTTETHDAFGRVVELDSATKRKVIYGPGGEMLWVGVDTSSFFAYIPLPGKSKAIFNQNGLLFYRHGDQLGSSRLATTPSRTLYSSTAYAPYGEDYAGSGTKDTSFTGENSLVSPGLYDFPTRELDATQGRWLSPDSQHGILGNPQSFNAYAYIQNMLQSVDSSGAQEDGEPAFDIFCEGNGCSASFMSIGSFFNIDRANGSYCYKGGCGVIAMLAMKQEADVAWAQHMDEVAEQDAANNTDLSIVMLGNPAGLLLTLGTTALTPTPCDQHCQAMGTVVPASDPAGNFMFAIGAAPVVGDISIRPNNLIFGEMGGKFTSEMAKDIVNRAQSFYDTPITMLYGGVKSTIGVAQPGGHWTEELLLPLARQGNESALEALNASLNGMDIRTAIVKFGDSDVMSAVEKYRAVQPSRWSTEAGPWTINLRDIKPPFYRYYGPPSEE